MKTILSLAAASLWSRRATALLTVLSVATSFALLVAVERLRTTTRASFESTLSGTDLLVGARGSGVQLLLYSVFRIGEPVQEVSWESFETLAAHPEVAWSVPLALGDSVRSFRVLGTTADYFEHYRYGSKEPLRFQDGRAFQKTYGAVLGSDVARSLGWSRGHRFPIQHGISEDAHAHEHTDFEVVGILEPTGTPVDRTVHVSLAGLAAAHHEPGHAADHEDHDEDEAHAEHDHEDHDEDEAHAEHDHEDHGEDEAHAEHDHEDHGEDEAHVGHDEESHRDEAAMHEAHAQENDDEAHAGKDHPDHGNETAHAGHDHEEQGIGDDIQDDHDHEEPVAKLESVSAVLVGLRSKMGLFRMRAWVNDFPEEPLMAVMPARAFQQLWSTVSVAERALRIIAILVSLAGVIALVATVLATVQQRRREMALLRSVGASPMHVAALIMGEAALIALLSVVAALVAVFVTGVLAAETLVTRFGLRASPYLVDGSEMPWVGLFLLTAVVVSLLPAIVSYRRSLSDGLMVQT